MKQTGRRDHSQELEEIQRQVDLFFDYLRRMQNEKPDQIIGLPAINRQLLEKYENYQKMTSKISQKVKSTHPDVG